MSVDGVGRNLISMAVCGLLFFGLVLLIEYKFFAPKLWSVETIPITCIYFAYDFAQFVER